MWILFLLAHCCDMERGIVCLVCLTSYDKLKIVKDVGYHLAEPMFDSHLISHWWITSYFPWLTCNSILWGKKILTNEKASSKLNWENHLYNVRLWRCSNDNVHINTHWKILFPVLWNPLSNWSVIMRRSNEK